MVNTLFVYPGSKVAISGLKLEDKEIEILSEPHVIHLNKARGGKD